MIEKMSESRHPSRDRKLKIARDTGRLEWPNLLRMELSGTWRVKSWRSLFNLSSQATSASFPQTTIA